MERTVSDADGAVAFEITSLTPEDVDLMATDTTAGVALQQIATITFATPPAASGGTI
jgi:hypothetical protein